MNLLDGEHDSRWPHSDKKQHELSVPQHQITITGKTIDYNP